MMKSITPTETSMLAFSFRLLPVKFQHSQLCVTTHHVLNVNLNLTVHDVEDNHCMLDLLAHSILLLNIMVWFHLSLNHNKIKGHATKFYRSDK